jgi:FMN hydrolase / 5-amino-6-(5-phospho-D-ribitylamino)uracil phosphatase
MREVQAIIFDLDDTLWEVGPVIVRAEHAMRAFLATSYPRVLEMHTPESMRDLRARMALEHPAMRHDFTWLRLDSLRRLARAAGYAETMAEEAFAVFYRARNDVILFDDVMPALERLQGSFRLFAASNGNADLAAIGLAKYFEHALAAREAGSLKPDPRIFSLLLERAGLRPAQALHVGDDALADVEGARRAGLTPVWVNRSGAEWPLPASARPLMVRTLGELADLLEMHRQ